MKHIARVVFGAFLSIIGAGMLASLIFIYSAALFSGEWPFMDPVQDTFRMLFTIPSGVVMLYAIFIGIFIPAIVLVIAGWYLLTGRYVVSKAMLILLVLFWACAVTAGFFLTFQQTQKVFQRVAPFSEDPLQFDVAEDIPDSVQYVFRTTLKNEARQQFGTPEHGYQPHMFLMTFPGLTESDFDAAETSVGKYVMRDGRLEHEIDDTRLVHPAAKALTDRGFDTLLSNVSVRLGIDLRTDGTLTAVMNALVRAEPMYDQEILDPAEIPMICTMEAKICPDGSSVGRVPPSCAFAECPGSL